MLYSLFRYVGTDSIYSLTSKYERDPQCIICGPATIMEVSSGASLQETIDQLVQHPLLKGHLSAPSVSYGHKNLYMRGVLEDQTQGNLCKPLVDLIDGSGSILTINDKKMVSPLKVKIIFVEHDKMKE